MKKATYGIGKRKRLEINCVLSYAEYFRSKIIASVYVFLKAEADLDVIPDILWRNFTKEIKIRLFKGNGG